MIINHNINALTAYNKTNAAGKAKSSAMEKLSSGLRINSAADDAAGSAINEKMKAQIRGLEQAGRNVQDGVSLVQTAEAGLGSIQNPNLSRMRDLIVQALNGTLTVGDRTRIQNELENVKASINDIANNTEFNTTKVLTVPIKNNQQPIPPVTSTSLDIVFMVDFSGSMKSMLSDGKSAIQSVKDGIGDFMSSMSNGYNTRIAVVNVSAASDYTPFSSDQSIIKGALNRAGGATEPYDSIQNSVPNGSIGQNLGYSIDSKKIFVMFTDAPNESNSSETDVNARQAVEGINNIPGYDNDDIQTFVFAMNDGNYSGTSVQKVTDTLHNIVDTTGGKIYSPKTSADISDKLKNDLTKEIKDSIPPTLPTLQDGEMPTLKLQVDANSGQKFEVQLFDARTKNLGIDDVSVDTIEEGEKSLQEVDKAIETVSTQRGKFGSYQNALEHIYNNVGNYGYNLTEADARISDVDMAKEVMEMAKSSILEESAQSMLKQADDMQKSVLNLMTKWQGSAE
ncbi:flagellin N-terminal helical domain-containing protein [Clostridium estertheticum]|uniref:flagellin N-terminal helical domain-containing protein n=1 Tax=Clostridium estertheticum TaxID=238834 RepID=UPI001C0DB47F|nr:flagellin [Clostridium estertheticum]MBU3186011.1 VWA domain-containing protein [Clostridium estertheticum]